jgi:hypothetical protein
MVYEISDIRKNNKRLRFIFSRIIPLSSLFLFFIVVLTWLLSFYKVNTTIFYVFFGLIVVFYAWWLIRWFEYIILLILWYSRYKSYQKLNLNGIIKNNVKTKQDKIYLNKYKKSNKKVDDLYHWVIIPTFQDPYSMLKDTFESIRNANYNNKKIIITLAGEQADEDNFKEIEKSFLQEYKDIFFSINTTLHPKWVEWELQGKGSNVTYAAKTTYKNILSKWIEADNILVSIMDSESIVQDRYFNSVSLEYCITSEDMQDKTIYQPMLFLFNRFFKSPFFAKIVALSTTFYILAASIKWVGTRAQAVQVQSLKSLLQTDFYSVETITEDWHQYYRTYCAFDGKFQVKPVYTYVLLEPVIGQNMFESIKLQYNQIKRWAHGALDLPYILICFLKNKKLPKLRTIYEILWLMEASVLWSSLQFILFFWTIYFLILWWIYGNVMSIFWLLWFMILVILNIITMFFLPWKDLDKKRKRVYESVKYMLFSFTIMGPMLLVLNWLPALHAQLLILFWKPMWKFNVTKKYRDE